jgi:cytochrome d ubiquinol oxidase subunit I
MEGQFRTQRGAPLRIGGLPDTKAGVTHYALEIPKGLSILAYNRPDAEVLGLEAFPASDRPPVPVVHVAFQVMVGCGMAMAAVALWGAVVAWRTRKLPDSKAFLLALTIVSQLGMVAIVAGWTVTEVGRQPCIVKGVMRTAEAVTPVPGLWISLVAYSTLYLLLGVVTATLLGSLFRASPRPGEIVADAAGGGAH